MFVNINAVNQTSNNKQKSLCPSYQLSRQLFDSCSYQIAAKM